MKTKVKHFPANGCQRRYKAYAVLMKKDTGGNYIMRELTIENGVITNQVDTIEDIFGVQAGKAITGIEDGRYPELMYAVAS